MVFCGNCESREATLYCLQCDKAFAYFCDNCIGTHNQMKAFRTHEVVPADATLTSGGGSNSSTAVAVPSPNESIGANSNSSQGRIPSASSNASFSNPAANIPPPKMTPPVNLILSKNKQLIDFDSQISGVQQFSGLEATANSQGTAADGQYQLSPRQEFSTGPSGSNHDPSFSYSNGNKPNSFDPSNGGFDGSDLKTNNLGQGNGPFNGGRMLSPGNFEASQTYDGGFRGRVGDVQMMGGGAGGGLQSRVSLLPPQPPQGRMLGAPMQHHGNRGPSQLDASPGPSWNEQGVSNMRHVTSAGDFLVNSMAPSDAMPGQMMRDKMQVGSSGVDYREVILQHSMQSGGRSNGAYQTADAAQYPGALNDGRAEFVSPFPAGDNSLTIYVECPYDKVKLVIGSKGVVIKNIMRRTNTAIWIDENYPIAHPRKIEVCGARDDVFQAKALLLGVIEYGPAFLEHTPGSSPLLSDDGGGRLKLQTSLNPSIHGGPMTYPNSPAGVSSLNDYSLGGGPMRGASGGRGLRGDYMMNPADIAAQRQEQFQQILRQQQQPPQPQYRQGSNMMGPTNGPANYFQGPNRNSPPFAEDVLYSRGGGGASRYPSNYPGMGLGSPHMGNAQVLNDLGSSRPGGFGKVATSIPPVVISEIYCPTERVSIIIGTKGVIINEISKRSNTIISIDEDPDKSIATLGARLANGEGNPGLPPKSPLRRIEIRGTLEGIEIAKHLINGVVASGPSFLTSGGYAQDATSRSFYAVGGSGPPSFDRSRLTPRELDETGQRLKVNSSANSSGKNIPMMSNMGNILEPSMNSSDGRLRQYDHASPRLFPSRPPSEGYLAAMQTPYDLPPSQQQTQGFMNGAGFLTSMKTVQLGGDNNIRLQDSKQFSGGGSQRTSDSSRSGIEGEGGAISGDPSGFALQLQLPPHQEDRQLRRLIHETLETITFPTKHIGELMGVNLRAICQHSGANIIVNADLPPEVPRILEVRGTPEQVASAHVMINDLLTKIAAAAGEDLALGGVDDADRILKSLSSEEPPLPILKKPPIGEIRLNTMGSVDSYESLGSGLLLSEGGGHGLGGSNDDDDDTDCTVEGSKGARIIKFPAVYLIAVMLSHPEILERIAQITGADVSIQTKQATTPPSPKNRSWQRSSSATKQLVAVTGEEDNVKEAVFLVRKVLAYLNGDPAGPVKQRIAAANDAANGLIFDLIEAPPKAIYRLIGFRGASIKEISEKSGASITVMNNVDKTKEPSTVLRQVVIFGSQASVTNAKDLIMLRMTTSSQDKRAAGRSSADTADGDDDRSLTDVLLCKPSSGDHGDDDASPTVHCRIECPPEKVGLIIGYKGVVIKNMMARSKAKIVVSEAPTEGKQARDIDVTGTARQVEIAKSMIDTIITHGNEALDQSVGSLLALGIVTKELSFPAQALDKLIAEKGADAFKSITRRRMNVVVVNNHTGEATETNAGGDDTSQGGQRTLLFKGTLSQIEKAENELREMLAQISAGTSVEQASSSILMMNSVDKGETAYDAASGEDDGLYVGGASDENSSTILNMFHA